MGAEQTQTRGQLLAERVRLERRLVAGWEAIDAAEAAGRAADVERYFTVWHGVLQQYERACDALAVRGRR